MTCALVRNDEGFFVPVIRLALMPAGVLVFPSGKQGIQSRNGGHFRNSDFGSRMISCLSLTCGVG